MAPTRMTSPIGTTKTMAYALHMRSTIIGIAPDPRRQLPRDLMRSAEYQLVLPELDASALALVKNGYLSALQAKELIDRGEASRVTEPIPRSSERSPAPTTDS